MNNNDLQFFKELLGESFNDGFGYEYNLFCCEQAVIIAETLETKEKIVEFHKADWEIQKKMVPLISEDHSGNTFEMACGLAITFLPQLKANRRDQKIDGIID